MQDYLLHRLRANNRHGVHSPFVYKLIDTVIYDYRSPGIEVGQERSVKKSELKPKACQLLYRLTKHFNPAIILKVGETNETTMDYIKKAVPDAKVYQVKEDITADMIIISASQTPAQTLNEFEQSFPKMHHDTVTILTGIYQNKAAKQTWKQIKADDRVRVTIDLFYFGLVFFKPGMSKEDFMVKY